ncbi:phosphotransferase enzyme family protein [Streptomyces sp. NPDC127098]|uniref:phosphotransferase enzyme family protein n=1 Tax=Streptomyces sp. NPDC127098 TaxID=3347137 RepID=UPI0036600BAA
MPTHPAPAEIAAALTTHWRLPNPTVTPLMGGMNSATWHVRHGAVRLVAKAVPRGPAEDRFHLGLRFADRVERAGLPSGAAVPTVDGVPTVAVAGHRLALLRWVEGRIPDPADEHDLTLVGATLGRAHRILGDEPVDPDEARATLDPLAEPPDPEVLAAQPWLRPALEDVAARLRGLHPETLNWGPLHGDPALEHVRIHPRTGRRGLIDWGAAGRGTRLYDLATVVMDLDTPPDAAPLLAAYRAHGPLSAEEIDRGLPALLAFRHAVNAVYYAERLLRGDTTGVADQAENAARLAEARRALGASTVENPRGQAR